MNQITGEYSPDKKTVKANLMNKYGDDIIFTHTANKETVICFKNTGHKIINDAWYEQPLKDEQEERLRIIKTAAEIIVEDIRSQAYETEHYPPLDGFLKGNKTKIPETLRMFIESVVMDKKRGDLNMWEKKSTAIAHCIIAAVRPRSFISPILLGLAVFLYKLIGSKKVVDVVSSMGLSSSYAEVVRFETSAINADPMQVNKPCFVQHVFDNADFNVQTVDGHNTFHVMGGISCISPKSAVTSDQPIPRLKAKQPLEVSERCGSGKLVYFERKIQGLTEIKFKDLDEIHTPTKIVVPTVPDLLWLYGKSKDLPGVCGWNGLMEEVTTDMSFEQTFVDYEPFINAPPSNYDTILTSLLTAVEKTKSLNQVTCLVTFDQPLYLKARDILASRSDDPTLSNVVRLGGFHLLMSFMGAIGYIMQGSGLMELFNTVYAGNTIEKIMSGHAYARAVRAHMLAHRTLAGIIIESMEIPSSRVTHIEDILLTKDRTVILSDEVNEIGGEFQEELRAKLELLADRGPTAKLWVEYFEMVTLLKHFIEAERSSNWDLHLQTVYKMLPFFHASGHNLYAKCSHLYLQDMHTLKDNMPASEYKLFTVEGCFSIRRSDKHWCGIWSDMAIEQTLMKSMKSSGGLTRGRGVSESVVTRWTQGMSALHEVCQEVEKFTGLDLATSEQHVDSRDTRQKRDNIDSQRFMNWFFEHPPFPETTDLLSINSGIVADERINCHLSKEIGMNQMKQKIGDNFQEVKFKRSERVQPLAIMNSSIQVRDKAVIINPITLFQRMTVLKHSDDELREFLSYELSPYPLSLFDEQGMRKGTKSSLYKALKPVELSNVKETIYVIDGGYLLHRVKWHHDQTYDEICSSYVSFVKTNYKPNAVVIFDGYPDESYDSTKCVERSRREKRKQSATIAFSDHMVPTVSQDSFLTNSKNKNRLISMLVDKFDSENMVSEQAVEDADTSIVKKALQLAKSNTNVTIVGEDIDLLVILIGLCKSDINNVFFLKPAQGKVSQRLYNPHNAIDKTISEHILFLHAMSGCDTTSALYNQGKVKFVKVLQKSIDLTTAINVFKHPNASQDEITDAGNAFLMELYGKRNENTLNDLRYNHYRSSPFKNKNNIASLPPTEAAAREHSLRVYFQVQQWLSGQEIAEQQPKDPNEWGWRKTKKGLVPVQTNLKSAPDRVLQKISCKCKKGCHGNCGCRKAGLNCSPLCLTCEGMCDNIDENILDEEEGAEEIRQCQHEEELSNNVEGEQATILTESPNHSTQSNQNHNRNSVIYEEPQPGPSKKPRVA